MLDDLPVVRAHGVHGLEADLPAGRRSAEEGPLVCLVIGLEGRSGLPIVDGVEVGEGLPKDPAKTRAPALSGVMLACGVWSMKSSANSSSKTSKMPLPCTSSVFRQDDSLGGFA
jgi:hypothetical protein